MRKRRSNKPVLIILAFLVVYCLLLGEIAKLIKGGNV